MCFIYQPSVCVCVCVCVPFLLCNNSLIILLLLQSKNGTHIINNDAILFKLTVYHCPAQETCTHFKTCLMIRTIFYISRQKQSSFQLHTHTQDPSAAPATPLRTGNVFITVTWASSGSTPHSEYIYIIINESTDINNTEDLLPLMTEMFT